VDAYTKAETDAKIKAITIGGNNLVKNSALPILTPNGSDTGTPAVMSDVTGYFVRYTPSSTSVIGVYGMRVPGSNLGNHTRSIEVRHSHTSNVTVLGQAIPPNKWVRVVQESFTSPVEFFSFTTDVPGVALDIRHYKIELGNKVTDWTPHPDEYITGTNSKRIDDVFTLEQDGINVGRDGNAVVITGIPYMKDVSIILECYLIFADGVSVKVEQPQHTTDGKLKFPATLASRDIVKKIYVKALIK
jgi:hypothetical protein